MTSTDGNPELPEEILLFARDLAVGYAGVPVVRDQQLTVRRGECVALVGGNGSGKTTLLRTLLGILPPLAGEITYGVKQARRPALGYVPQRDQLDPTFPLTVAEVVRMGAYRRWRPFLPVPEARADRVRGALAKVGAAGWERRVLHELSGGQRQRVLIARALMAEPDLLLLDEPTTGIDVSSEEAIYEEIARWRAAGLGILMVSHDLTALTRVATRALLIRDGSLLEVGVEDLQRPEYMRALLCGHGTDD